MEFNIQIKTLSVFKILEIIDPMIKENFELETQYKIIQGLKEIDLKVNKDLKFFTSKIFLNCRRNIQIY